MKSRIAVMVTILAALAVLGTNAAAGGSLAPGSSTTSSAASTDKPENLQEVTVTAHRAELAQKLSRFVDEITVVESEEGLPVWHRPVCPLAWGLAERDDAFIVERVQETARVAGVPLGREHCTPNLFIFVTTRPQALLQAMERRNFQYNFGDDAYPLAVDELIAIPRAARVWFTSYTRTPDGLPAGHVVHIQDNPSPLSLNIVRWIAHAYVIVDENRLRAVTLGQLADYVSLTGLAQLKAGARVGDTSTILKLFDVAPQAAPAGMTDWDKAFLKSLYATDQKSTLQRSQIAHQMLHEVAPQ